MSNLSEIGVNLSTYLNSISPQVKGNSLQWYISGSLASILLASSESITEIELDSDNNIEKETIVRQVSKKQREKLSKFDRKLGKDIDIINVNGNLIEGIPLENRPHAQKIIQNVPNILDLMSWEQSTSGTMFIDSLEVEREISYHPVVKVKTASGDFYITAPPELLAHKIAETITFSKKISENKTSEKIKSKYEKDIKDLSSMFYGFKDLYEKDEFLNRVYYTLNEKDRSLFSIKDPIDNNTTFEEHQNFKNNIMKRIIEDSSDYLKSITDKQSASEINEFFNYLLDKRKIDIERKSRINLTPLMQREAILSSLEKESEEYDEKLEKLELKGKNK